MGAPKGLGWFVAFERSIDDGPKKADLQHAINVCEVTNATWVCARAGAGGGKDADLNEESIAAYVAAGLQVVIWVFDYAGTEAGELATFKRFYDLGVRAAVLNAEFEYLSANAAQARAFVQKLRAMGYEWVAHAPPAYAGARGDGPLKELDVDCDAILPQVYAYEINDQGHVHHLREVMKLYKARGYGPEKVWPILGSYRPRTRGYYGNDVKHPIPIPPMANEAAVVAADVFAGLEELKAMGVESPSIYTIDALHFVEPHVGAEVLAAVIRWASLQERHEPPPTLPEGAATPIRAGEGEYTPPGVGEIDQDSPVTDPGTPVAIERRASSSQRIKAVVIDEDPSPETPKGGAA